jgi:hypothetical protein
VPTSKAKPGHPNPAKGGSSARDDAPLRSSLRPRSRVLELPRGVAEGFRNPCHERENKTQRLSNWIPPPPLPIPMSDLRSSARYRPPPFTRPNNFAVFVVACGVPHVAVVSLLHVCSLSVTCCTHVAHELRGGRCGFFCRHVNSGFVEVDTVWHHKFKPTRLLLQELARLAQDIKSNDASSWPDWLPPSDILELEPGTVICKGEAFSLYPPVAERLEHIATRIHAMQDDKFNR